MIPENSPQYEYPMSKAEPKESKRYVVHMISGQYSQVAQLSRGISSMSNHQQNSTGSRTVCTPFLVVVVKYTKVRHATN